MTGITLDLLCASTAGVIGVVGVILLIWSLAWDRARSRQRCPRCWYDMSGAPALTCPECGHDARRPARLTRTRRRWRWATFATMLLLIAAVTGFGPHVWRNGWRTVIPDAVLITVWPLSPKDWIDSAFKKGGLPTGAMAELQRRIFKDELSHWAAARWAARVESQLRRDGHYASSETAPMMTRIRAARITRTFTNEPLHKVFEELARQIGADLRVDWTHLETHGAPRDHPVTLSLTHAAGDDAFRRVFLAIGRPQVWKISFGFDPHTLVIGSEASTPLSPFNCDALEALGRIKEWIPPGPGFNIWHRRSLLTHAATLSVDPLCWKSQRGVSGEYTWIQHRFVGTLPTRDITDLVSLVNCLNDCSPGSTCSPDPTEADSARKAILLLKSSAVRLPFANPTARQIAAAVTRSTGVPVDLDWSGLDTDGMCESPGFAGPTETTAYEALERMAAWYWRPHYVGPGGGWTVWRGAVRLFRADASNICNITTIGVYNVADLAPTGIDATTALPDDTAAPVIDAIMRYVEPNQWIDSGGWVGRLNMRGPTLVITTTSKQHLMIEDVLADLRAKHAQGTPLPPLERPALPLIDDPRLDRK